MSGARSSSLRRVRAAGSVSVALLVGCVGRGGGEEPQPPDRCLAPRPPPAARVVCPPPATVECAGRRTPVALADLGAPPALADDPCGTDAIEAVLDDLPAEGLPLGAHAVQLGVATRHGGVRSCTTTVEVVDTTPPVVEPPPPEVRVRRAPDEVLPPTVAPASDACDPAVAEARADLAELPRGTSTVRYEARDASGLTSSAEVVVEVREAFAAPDLRVLGGALRSDGATDAWLAWERPGGADATAVAVERREGPAAEWTRLATLELDVRTYVDRAIPPPRAHYRLVTLAGELDGGTTPVVVAHAITGDTYDLRERAVPTVPFATTLYGVTRHPVELEDGAHPLVLLLHGNHGICRRTLDDPTDLCTLSEDHECGVDGWVTTPNAEGLSWLAESLAVQGRVAATLSANAMNCRRDFNRERSELLVEHLRQWKVWAEGEAAPFGARFRGKVDLGRVGLFGHSRGGEAVALVPEVLARTPIEGLSLRSIFALAPVDFHDPSPDGVPYAVLLPTCDGDVVTLEGQHVYDRTLAEDGGAPLVQLAFVGANHNFFNTEWRIDDNQFPGFAPRTCATPTGVTDAHQRALLEAAVGRWAAATVDAAPAPPALDDWLAAAADLPASVDAWAGTTLDVRVAHAAPSRRAVDDFAAAGAPDTNAFGEPNGYDDPVAAALCVPGACGSRYRHLRRAVSLSWSAAGGRARFGLPSLDAAAEGFVVFRVASRVSDLNAGRDGHDVTVALRDADGRVATARAADHARIPHLYPAFAPFELLSSVRVPLAAFEAEEPLDLGALAALELVVDGEAGALLVADVAFEPPPPPPE